MTADAVEQLLERAVRAGLAPAAIAAWGRAGARPSIAAAGRARLLPSAERADRDTWFDLASLTKPLVTGTLAMLAVRDRAMSLDSSVGEVLPEAGTRPIAGVTVRQLLAHSSGLPGWRPLYALAAARDRIIDALLGLELEHEPGCSVRYGCPGFLLLGAMLERALGEPLDLAFARRVSGPLGLHEVVGFRPDPGRHRLAGGAAEATVERRLCRQLGVPEDLVPAVAPHLPDDGNARFLGGVAGNAGLFGTAEGVFMLASQYVAAASRILEPEEIALATARTAGGREPEEQVRALAWQLALSPGCSAGPALGQAAFGHTGFTGTSAWVDPQREAVLVLLANRHHPGHHEVDLHPLRRRFHAIAARDLSVS